MGNLEEGSDSNFLWAIDNDLPTIRDSCPTERIGSEPVYAGALGNERNNTEVSVSH